MHAIQGQLDGSSGESKVRGSSQHVAVAGPDFSFSQFLGGGEMNRIGCSDENVTRSRNQQE